MEGLNGTITFKSAEYRPCTAKGRPALFHKWEENSDIYAPSLMAGGHAGGVVKYTRAIVEYEDGHVERVQPEDVIFVDNYFREFAFPENQSEAPKNPPEQTAPRYTDKRINCPHCGGNNKNAVVLDAAATDKSAKCKEYFTPETDGLKSSWNRGGAVFCNPPYGRSIGLWVEKAFNEAKAGTTIVLLIPSRTDTTYFHEYIYGKAEIRFIRGRLTFTDEDGNPQTNAAGKPTAAPFPSMVVIYNPPEKEVNV